MKMNILAIFALMAMMGIASATFQFANPPLTNKAVESFDVVMPISYITNNYQTIRNSGLCPNSPPLLSDKISVHFFYGIQDAAGYSVKSGTQDAIIPCGIAGDAGVVKLGSDAWTPQAEGTYAYTISFSTRTPTSATIPLGSESGSLTVGPFDGSSVGGNGFDTKQAVTIGGIILLAYVGGKYLKVF